MNKLLTKSIFLVILITSFMSCFKERIDIDLNENNKKLVVSAWITDLNEPQYVKLSYTTNYLDSKTQARVVDAVVKLSTTAKTYTLDERENGVYYLPIDWSSEIGQKYTLSINDKESSYTATTIMRACPDIENLEIIKTVDEEFGEEPSEDSIYVTNFDFQEIKGVGDGYFVKDYKEGSLRKDSISNGSFVEDEFYDNFYLEDISVSQVGYEIGDTVILDMFSIGVEATKFLQDIENEKFRGGLFDPPPVNIRTNISNGAIGYFIIGGAKRDTVVVK